MTVSPRALAIALAAAVAAIVVATTGCGSDDDSATSVTSAIDRVTTDASDAEVRLRPDMTWHWQLQGDLDTSVDAAVYDIDLFDTSADTIDQLHADGRIVICYFSTAYEEWRVDADDWPHDVLGAPLDDWAGERWVDIRAAATREILAGRLDLAMEKGCDGVEPDNVTAYRSESGFELDAADQLRFIRFLAEESHERGVLIGLKNDLEQIPDLVADVDFAVNEQCVEFDECDAYRPFVDAHKPVFGAEYSDEALEDPDAVCAVAADAGISALVLPVELDGSLRIECER